MDPRNHETLAIVTASGASTPQDIVRLAPAEYDASVVRNVYPETMCVK